MTPDDIPLFTGWPIKNIARWINAELAPDFKAEAVATTASTYSKIAGTRMRRPGLGRSGYILTVWRKGEQVIRHNSAETYRQNYEIARALREQVARRK